MLTETKPYKFFGNVYELTKFERYQIISFHRKTRKQVKEKGLTDNERNYLGTPIMTREDIQERQKQEIKNNVIEYIENIITERKKEQTYYFHDDKQDQEKAITEQKQRITDCHNFLNFIGKNYDHKHFMIAWDICNYDHYSLQSDLYRGNITKSMIQTIYNLACKMFQNVNFYIDYILEC